MKQINRWILSCQNRVANIWYNQDYTVYGLNPSAGPQPPNNSNTVTVYDVVGEIDNTPGVIALQCTGNPGAGIPTAYANMCPPLSYHVMFQDPNGGWFQSFTSLQPVPTGDGYFALYVPAAQRYVAVDPDPDPAASNCNVLFGLDDDISHAARFTATGLDRPSALDVLDAQATGGKNASGMIFRGISLAGRDLSGWNLSGCDFRGALSLSACKMAGANLQRARFAGLHLGGLTLSGTDCTGADFTGCDFTGISPGTPPPVLADANLTGAVVPGGMSFSGAKMAGAVLAQATVTTTDLSGADLAGANFSGQGVSYFTPVWTYPGPFDLNNPADRVIAYDYASIGKLDHLVCYRPGTGMVWIMQRNADGSFARSARHRRLRSGRSR